MKGILHSIESLAARDGEGLRCGVFLAGCPLRCVYCHNPDTWAMQGTEVSAEDLFKKICRFRPYFGADGGVTFSGGEPLLQSKFLAELTPLLKDECIPYALDTSGQVLLSESVRFVLSDAQTVILDLKFWDDESYRALTGVGIQKTLDFLNYLEEIGANTTVRTVIVPGINDTEEHVKRYLALLSSFSCVKKYELLPFHTMGFFKYENLGIENPLKETKALDPNVLKKLQRFVK